MSENSDKSAPKRKRGRPAGSAAIPSRERNRMIAQSKIKPLQVLMDTMADRWERAQAAKNPKTRDKLQGEACAVAEKVAPYLHPKLQATTLKGDDKAPLAFALNLPSVDVLKAAIRGKTEPDKGKA